MAFRFYRHLITIIGIVCLHTGMSGQTLPVTWKLDHQLSRVWPDSLDLSDINDSCRSIASELHRLGYLAASLDSVDIHSRAIMIHFHVGNQYKWNYLDLSSIPEFLLDGLKISIRPEKLYNHEAINVLFDRILTNAENNGYPFAAVRLDSIGIKNQMVEATVQVKLNDKINIERIRLDGDLKLKDRYLQHILNIREGDIFNKQKIVLAKDRIESVPFVKSQQDPVVNFLGNSATIQLYLDRKNANRFDILLGLLPSNNPNKRFQLTGNVDIDMANQFGAGEIFRFKYENLMPGTQNLELGLNYPFIFGWSFGTDLDFQLYKRDSTYIDLGYNIGIQYFLKGDSYLRFFIEKKTTDLLTVDTARIKRTQTLPTFIDTRHNLLGATWHFERLNYRLNPRKGSKISISGSAGNKKIKKNNTIVSLRDGEEPGFNFNTLYNDLNLNSFQFKLSASLEKYFPLFKSSTLLLANHTALIGSGERLYNNELYRIGGTKLLRGFNEESIFARFYNVLTLEYRLLFNQNSNFFYFIDIGFYDRNDNEGYISDQPLGTGVGLNLETKVGIFSISYAIGKAIDSPFSFRSGVVHFGMVSGF